MHRQVGRVESIQDVCGSLGEVEYNEKRENIREHEREKEYLKLDNKILNRVCSLVRRQKVHRFPHAR